MIRIIQFVTCKGLTAPKFIRCSFSSSLYSISMLARLMLVTGLLDAQMSKLDIMTEYDVFFGR